MYRTFSMFTEEKERCMYVVRNGTKSYWAQALDLFIRKRHIVWCHLSHTQTHTCPFFALSLTALRILIGGKVFSQQLYTVVSYPSHIQSTAGCSVLNGQTDSISFTKGWFLVMMKMVRTNLSTKINTVSSFSQQETEFQNLPLCQHVGKCVSTCIKSPRAGAKCFV